MYAVFIPDYLKDELEKAVLELPVTVHIIRMKTRIGLVGARLAGAKIAIAPVLLFLDAHCEAAPGFLEPLLAHLQISPHSAVCPIIGLYFVITKNIVFNQ